MKLFELYKKRALREDKSFNASMQLCESIVKALEAEATGSYGVWSKGGSIGGRKSDEPIATFDNRPEAMEYAKRRRRSLSPGERKYYGMGYSVRPYKGKVGEGLNDAGSFDFEPDPAFAGVKGTTRTSGAGEKEAGMAKHKLQNQKLNQTWQKLAGNLGKLDGQRAQQLKMNMQKVADMAKKRNFTLSPNPDQILGL
jgi:hypothetical protein